jgi:hypothetical protein
MQWQFAQVVTAFRQDVEGTELHLFVMPTGMKRVEIRYIVHAQYHRLAINDESLLPVLQRGLDDPRVTLGPVLTAARDQPHTITIALQP